MNFALNEKHERIEVQYSGQRAICNYCRKEVIGRYGKVRPKHWYHKNLKTCDSWFEPMTQWHIDWQNNFPKENLEVILNDNADNKKHIADICLNNGLVIEIQNSHIKIDEIIEREQFYTKNGGLIWILNGANLLKNCSLSYMLNKKGHSLYFEIPSYLEKVRGYDFDELRSEILNSETVQQIKDHPCYQEIDILNGNFISFKFSKAINFTRAIELLEIDISNILKEIYPESKSLIEKEIKINFYSVLKDDFFNVILKKRYWRQFIDSMKSPVFIDNITGLDENFLFWYQKKEIIKKENFMNKYLVVL